MTDRSATNSYGSAAKIKNLIVPVSGGKDSQVCLSLALRYLKTRPEIKLFAVHQNTGFDHDRTYKQIEEMERFYGVEITHTKSTRFPLGMFDFLRVAKYFPNSSARGCTERLKQEPFARWLIENKFTPEDTEIWFGMRTEESAVRANKYSGLACDDVCALADVGLFYGDGWRKKARLGEIPCRLPIVTWSEKEVFDFIADESAPLNELYALGHHRVGCYPCLLSRKAEWVAAASDPQGRTHLTKLLQLQAEWAAEGNPRKFIKVHRVWDVQKFLDDGGNDLRELKNEECGYCSI